MPQALQFFILLPLLAFLASMLLPRKKERIQSQLAVGSSAIHLVAVIVFIGYWLANGYPVLDIKHIVLFKTTGFEIFIDFFFDKVTAVYALVGAVLTFVVIVFSRFYLHREEGFKRFFNTILLFTTGYNLIIFSGNFETLFIGWELLGISSFLLIAFYRDRYLPVRNAVKVISVYRLSDICLLVAMWLSHHLWHENITFWKLNDLELVARQVSEHAWVAIVISIMLLVAAAAKSGQLPFSSWLPRAMEGPTTSTAIFYGSLSVHIGVFVLLRTYPFWQGIAGIKIAVILTGLLTSFVAAAIARVQPTVKTQIAYSSIVQIGIIFIEVALGFHILALFHFAANAFLRTYQLLVSPSVLSYLTHDQFYHFDPSKPQRKPASFNKIRNTVYMLGIKEWNLDFILYRYCWSPFKWLGRQLHFLSKRYFALVLALVFIGGLFVLATDAEIPGGYRSSVPVLYSVIGLLLVLGSFAERGDARKAWLLVLASEFFIVLSIALNEKFDFDELLIYASGTAVAAIAGYICLYKAKLIDDDIELNRFHGYSYETPMLAFVFLLSCLGLLGFPVSPAFIGVDLLFTHIHEDQGALIVFTALSFLFIELSVLRIYARIFMGQHKKSHHAIAFRSS